MIRTLLQAAVKKGWIYIGKVKATVTADKVEEYIKAKIPGKEFTVEELQSKGLNKAYKIGVDFNIIKDFLNPDFWPKGIIVKRFQFFRRRNTNNPEYITQDTK